MPIRLLWQIEIGYGVGKGADAFAVGTEVAQKALLGIREHPLAAVLVFASVSYDLDELLHGVNQVVGEAPVLGNYLLRQQRYERAGWQAA